MISLIYIVKNEAKNIGKSIESCYAGVDEIIVVDTGSTDKTKDICSKFNCKIYDYTWNDNFSDARNYALSKAHGDWIIFLDADEYFQTKLDKTFPSVLRQLDDDGINLMKVFTLNIDTADHNRVLHTSYGTKIFKNENNPHYINPIHEYLVFDDNDKIRGSLTNDFTLVHTGYSSDIVRKKPERNLHLLQKYESTCPEDEKTSCYYYLMRETLSLDLYDEAELYCQKFFQRNDYQSFIQSVDIGYLAYIYAYMLLSRHNYIQKEKVEFWSKALTVIESPDYYYHLGLLFINENIDMAYDYFNKAIYRNNELLQSDYFNTFIQLEPELYYHLARLSYLKKDYKEAFSTIQVACALNRQNPKCLGLLLKICKNKKSQTIINIINRLYQPHNKEEYEFIVDGLVNTELYEVFCYYALIYNNEYQGNNSALFMAMTLRHDYDTALMVAYTIYKNTQDEYYLDIITMILLYANKKELYNVYMQCLTDVQIDIIKWYTRRTKINDDSYRYYINNILKRLLYLDCTCFIHTVDINRLDQIEIYAVLSTLESLSRYKEIIQLCQQISNITNKDIVELYVLSLYMTEKYSECKQYIRHIDSNLLECNYIINLLSAKE